MISRAEALVLAQSVVDYTTKSHVGAAMELAKFLVRDEADRVQLTDDLTCCRARSTELIEERRTLAALIEKIATAGPDDRDEMIAEAVVAARGSL